MPLYERIALYSVADVAVVTATRDGMNLVPYEYIVCRQGMKARRRPPGAVIESRCDITAMTDSMFLECQE